MRSTFEDLASSPGRDLLHNVVAEGWLRLRERLAEAARSLPRHVIAEVEGYLKCGDPEHGFAVT